MVLSSDQELMLEMLTKLNYHAITLQIKHQNFLQLLFNFLLFDIYALQFDSLKKIRKSKVPTLFLSGLADQLIPPRMMTSLYKVCFDQP